MSPTARHDPACAPACATGDELIARVVDGPQDPAAERELARRIATDPALGRLLRRHLCIAEVAHQALAEERGGARFAAGWDVRLAAEADAALFTARTVLRIVASDADRRGERVVALLRVGGLAAAALLMAALGLGASALVDAGRGWLDRRDPEVAAQFAGTPYAQRGVELRRLREGLR